MDQQEGSKDSIFSNNEDQGHVVKKELGNFKIFLLEQLAGLNETGEENAGNEGTNSKKAVEIIYKEFKAKLDKYI